MTPSDDSIRNDASAMTPGQDPSLPEPGPGHDSKSVPTEHGEHQQNDAQPGDPQQVDQANTVIRGSSRPDRPGNALQRTPAVVAQVLLGQQLNQYLVEDLIGGGGMGAVFRAHDQQLDRTVAIKVIPFVGDDPDLQRRFRNEAQSAAKLDHPRIARVFDAGNHDEWHYIVFEYIEGTNIRDQVLSNGVCSIDDAVYYTSQLASAIQHAADRGIVHRDIKPSNIIVGSEGTLKLVDMGLARSEHLEMSDDMTASGVTLGTFDYISPEQAHDPRNADLRSDIYSLGCTLYFMLTGSPPYPGGTMAQKVISHGTAPPPDAKKLRPAVSDHLMAVLNKMLAKSPSDRYADANDLLADLREVALRDNLARTYKLAPLPLPRATPSPAWFYQYSPWIAALAILLLTAGWLRLESASLRDEVTVPDSAVAPQPVAAFNAPDDPGTPTDGQAPASDTETESAEVADDQPDSQSEEGDDSPTNVGGEVANPENVVSAEAPAPRVIRLVDRELSPRNNRDDDGAVLTNRLDRAIDLANEYGVGQIEVSAPTVFCKPIRIESEEPLIIRSTVGGSTLAFRTTDQSQRSPISLVSIDSSRVEFEDLHFRWDGPDDRDDGGIVFDIRGNHQIRLNRCSLTVRNSQQSDNVFGFNVVADSPWREFEALLPIPSLIRSTKIDLRNTVIRGGMTMLALDGNADLQLTWDNGLLAIAGRMIAATGTRVAQGFRQQRAIELMLTRLTAHAPQGLVRVQASTDAPHPISVDRQSLNSLFFVGARNPHFEFVGLSSLSNQGELLRMRGASNWYVINRRGSDSMLKLESLDGESQVTAINDIQASQPTWFRDPLPRWTANPWSDGDLDSIDPADRTTKDYRADDPSAAGFDLESMPQIPVVQIPADQISAQATPRGKLSSGRAAKKAQNTPNLEPDLTFPLSSDLIGGLREQSRLLGKIPSNGRLFLSGPRTIQPYLPGISRRPSP